MGSKEHPAMSNAQSATGRKYRILVVDDNPANLRLLAIMLGDHGFTVHTADGAKIAFRFLEAIIPDLILLDVRMPEMDGFQMCERLKADQRTRDIPVIFVSASNDPSDKVKAFHSGGADYILKPLLEEDVLARIANHLST
jgi:CheY-like chemotaxis protein